MLRITAIKLGYRSDAGIGLYIDRDVADRAGCGTLVGPLKFEYREPYVIDTAPPPITLGTTEAQALMDSLWSVGLRPTEGSGSAGSFAAQGEHLKDLQRLVFDHVIVKRGEHVQVV